MRSKHLFVASITSIILSACSGEDTPSASSSSYSDKSSSSSSVNSSSVSSSQSVSSEGVSGPAVDLNTDLPSEMRISDDGERLEMGGFYESKFFNDTEIETIELSFTQNNYTNLLANNKNSEVPIEATLSYKGKVYQQVGVRYRGQTSYSRAGDKKSLNIDLDWMIDGQDINGFNSFKLNNGYEDTSNMREVLFNNLSVRNITSAKASFARVLMNGTDYGVFAKVQKLDKDHVKEWYFDKDGARWRAEAAGGGGGGRGGNRFGAGKSSLNDLGVNGTDYQTAYTLKNNDADNWQDLANAAHTLGTTSPDKLVDELGKYLDIDATLWMLATENVFADDDSYINKGGMDYYVYFDAATKRIIPIEYDGNSVLGSSKVSSWTPFYNEGDSNFALMNILFKVPQLRQRYLAHYRTVLEESLDPSMVEAKIEAYSKLIDTYVRQAKITQYSNGEYESGVSSLRKAIRDRYNFVSKHNEVNRTGPSITGVTDSVNGVVSVRPSATQNVLIKANITAQSGVGSAYLYYGTGLAGRFTKIAMSNDGASYTATIPAMGKGEYVRYYIEAVANDKDKTVSYSPKGAEHDIYIYQVKAADKVASAVVINELMADNETVVSTPEGKFSDWVELYNNSDVNVDLSGYYLTDEDIKLTRWAFPGGTVIPAKGTLVVWLDDDEDLVTALHANFNLSAKGESLYLVTPDLQFADKVTFSEAPEDQSYSRAPNGIGAFEWTTKSSMGKSN